MILLLVLFVATVCSSTPTPSPTIQSEDETIRLIKMRLDYAMKGTCDGDCQDDYLDVTQAHTREPIPVAASSTSAALTLKQVWEQRELTPLSMSDVQRVFISRGMSEQLCRLGQFMGLAAGRATLLEDVICFQIERGEQGGMVAWIGNTLGTAVPSLNLEESTTPSYFLWRLPSSLVAWVHRNILTGAKAKVLHFDELKDLPDLSACTLRGLIQSTAQFEGENVRLQHISIDLIRQTGQLLSALGLHVERDAAGLVIRGRVGAYTVALLGGEWFSQEPLAPLLQSPPPIFDSILLHWVALRRTRLHSLLHKITQGNSGNALQQQLFRSALWRRTVGGGGGDGAISKDPTPAPSPNRIAADDGGDLPPTSLEMTHFNIPFSAPDDMATHDGDWVEVFGMKVRAKVGMPFVLQGRRRRSISLEFHKDSSLWGLLRVRFNLFRASSVKSKVGKPEVVLTLRKEHFNGDTLVFDSDSGIWFPDEGRWVQEPEVTLMLDDPQYSIVCDGDGGISGNVMFSIKKDPIQKPVHIEFSAPNPEQRYVMPWQIVNGLRVCVVIGQRNVMGRRWMGLRIDTEHRPVVHGHIWWGIEFYENAESSLKRAAVKWQFGDDMETTVTPLDSSKGGFIHQAATWWQDMGLTFHRTLYNEYSQALGPREELAGRIVMRFTPDPTVTNAWKPIIVLAPNAARRYSSLWITQRGDVKIRGETDCSLPAQCFLGAELELPSDVSSGSPRNGTFEMKVELFAAGSEDSQVVWSHTFGSDLSAGATVHPFDMEKGVKVVAANNEQQYWTHPGVALSKDDPAYTMAMGSQNQIRARIWYKFIWGKVQEEPVE